MAGNSCLMRGLYLVSVEINKVPKSQSSIPITNFASTTHDGEGCISFTETSNHHWETGRVQMVSNEICVFYTCQKKLWFH